MVLWDFVEEIVLMDYKYGAISFTGKGLRAFMTNKPRLHDIIPWQPSIAFHARFQAKQTVRSNNTDSGRAFILLLNIVQLDLRKSWFRGSTICNNFEVMITS